MKDSAVTNLAKYDRYKASSYRAYNQKMPAIYDKCIWMRLFEIDICDQLIIAEIGENMLSSRILDVGCATGRLLEKLAQKGAKNLSGTDLAPNILEVAQQKLLDNGIHADLKPADVEDYLPWPENSFDVVILLGVVHHLFRPLDALYQIHRVLAPKGKLIIMDPWLPIVIRQIVNLWLYFFPHDGDYHFYTPKQLEMILQKTGLSDMRLSHIQYHKVGIWSYIVTGKKQPQKGLCKIEIGHILLQGSNHGAGQQENRCRLFAPDLSWL